MREIKFRQWTGSRYCYWGFIDETAFISPSSGNSDGGYNALNTDHQQYTGLKDKNGKDIYEGDIVSIGRGFPIIRQVYYMEETASFQMDMSPHVLDQEVGNYENIEVIGNIYETPELLK